MNEIVIPVCDLKAALPGLNKIVSKRSTLPVLQTVRVARDAAGRVSLLGTDLDAFATYTLKEAQPGPAVFQHRDSKAGSLGVALGSHGGRMRDA